MNLNEPHAADRLPLSGCRVGRLPTNSLAFEKICEAAMYPAILAMAFKVVR